MEQIYMESAMEVRQKQTQESRTGSGWYRLIVSVCLCVGCGFTLSSMYHGILDDQTGILGFTLGALVFFGALHSRSSFRQSLLIGLIAAGILVIVGAFLITEAKQQVFWGVMEAVAFLVNLGLRLRLRLICIFATLIPAVVGIQFGSVPDIWYLGLLIISWCGILSASMEKPGKPSESLEELQGQASDYRIWMVVIFLILILLYGILFSAKAYYGTSWLQQVHAQTSDIIQSASHNISLSTKNTGTATADTHQQSPRNWMLFLIPLLVCIILAAAYELVKRIRLCRRFNRFTKVIGDETVYDMYRYLCQLFRFVKLDINAKADTSADTIATEYENNTDGSDNQISHFSTILIWMNRLRFGKRSLTVEEQKAMAAYCQRISRSIYKKQNLRRRFIMKFIKVCI